MARAGLAKMARARVRLRGCMGKAGRISDFTRAQCRAEIARLLVGAGDWGAGGDRVHSVHEYT